MLQPGTFAEWFESGFMGFRQPLPRLRRSMLSPPGFHPLLGQAGPGKRTLRPETLVQCLDSERRRSRRPTSCHLTTNRMVLGQQGNYPDETSLAVFVPARLGRLHLEALSLFQVQSPL